MDKIQESFNKIVSEQIDKLSKTIERYYDQYNKLYEMFKQDSNFNILDAYRVENDDCIGCIFSYKDFTDYRCVLTFNPNINTIQLHIIVKIDEHADFDYNKPMFNGKLLKFIYLNDFYEDCDIKAKYEFAVKIVDDVITENYNWKTGKKDYLTAVEFTEKVQELMHPGDSYLFEDPISCEQENFWFYNKLVEKIKKHPLLWKWFFSI